MYDSKPRISEALLALVLLFVPLAAGAATEEAGETKLSPKGIYHAVDELHRTGVKFFVELGERNRKPRRVPVSHDFVTGDKFTFSFEINRDAYIYVINQTLSTAAVFETSGLSSKRVERVYVDVTPPPPPVPVLVATSPPRSRFAGSPRLLFPTVKAGSNNRLKAERPYKVPHRGYYAMDDQTGTERLYVVISERRLDLSDCFDRASGRLRADAADRLRRQITEWKENTEVEFVGKGIVHNVASYGVSIDPAKPAVVEIDLRHCR